LDSVFPAHSETPRGIDEANDICVECPVDGIHDSEFSQSLHHHQDHDADNDEADDDGAGTATLEGTAHTDEESGADGATLLLLVCGSRDAGFGGLVLVEERSGERLGPVCLRRSYYLPQLPLYTVHVTNSQWQSSAYASHASSASDR